MHGFGPEEVGPPGPRMEASYPPAEVAETAVRTQQRGEPGQGGSGRLSSEKENVSPSLVKVNEAVRGNFAAQARLAEEG